MKTYLNHNEASAILGISTHTLYQWRFRGFGPKYYKIGRKVGYLEQDIKDWVGAQQHSGTNEYATA